MSSWSRRSPQRPHQYITAHRRADHVCAAHYLIALPLHSCPSRRWIRSTPITMPTRLTHTTPGREATVGHRPQQQKHSFSRYASPNPHPPVRLSTPRLSPAADPLLHGDSHRQPFRAPISLTLRPSCPVNPADTTRPIIPRRIITLRQTRATRPGSTPRGSTSLKTLRCSALSQHQKSFNPRPLRPPPFLGRNGSYEVTQPSSVCVHIEA